ncbi:Bone morphogenetic protein receptor type-2 [Liparis tanakae]|uniref:Bone morphogenetic protein receptor type-2 n=1 Tax=Liparis tanakae TaxID=230148 RepID=A0A4Z2FPX0_9TELE|nr:Bone morphogenetic protein receptor type-2 [Liparis tanakae]
MTPKSGPYADQPYIEEQEGVAKNTQADTSGSVSGRPGAGAGERNRNSINQERQQQANARLPSPEGSSTSTGLRGGSPSASTTTTTLVSDSEGPAGPVCLHLTQEDLETTKLDPKEVDKNLKESSDENLMEHSQKQFCSPDPLSPGSASLLYPLIKMASEAAGVSDPAAAPAPPATFPLPKQQNLPKRPSSLPLRTKPPKKESLRFKFGRSGKSNLRQAEGPKSNGGAAAAGANAAAEAHRGAGSNNTGAPRANGSVNVNGAANGHANGHAGVAGSAVAPGAGPGRGGSGVTQNGTAGALRSDDGRLSLGVITASPDEHEPLLSREREQPGARAAAAASAAALRSARPNANNNNSNTGHGRGGGESGGESDGGGGGGEEEESGEGGSRETAGGEGSGSGAAAQRDAPVAMRGEALLRQHRARRPERPNSLDLTFTTQQDPRGDAAVQPDGAPGPDGDKIKKRVKTPYSLKKWRPTTWVISTDARGPEVNNNNNASSRGPAHGQGRPKSSSAICLRGGGGPSDTHV